MTYDEPDKAHLGGANAVGDANTIMPDVWGYLVVKLNVWSMVDIGCGYGHALPYFAGCGAHTVLGIDGDPDCLFNALCPSVTVIHDFATGPYTLKCDYDLAWSAEFLEHVDEKYQPNYMATFRQCRHVCVTHAVPWQPGHHHVLCRDDDYWIRTFAAYGFAFDAFESNVLRRTDRLSGAWGRKTLMLFHRL